VLGDDIADRLLEFAARCLKVVGTLPSNPEGKHVAKQLIRSGTSGGANYEEARRAESKGDFAHKVLIAAKEVGESVYWLKLAGRVRLSATNDLNGLIGEGLELVAILRSSAKTARRRAG
jgi:four helix bundle protein